MTACIVVLGILGLVWYLFGIVPVLVTVAIAVIMFIGFIVALTE